jgi:hypothetical protein
MSIYGDKFADENLTLRHTGPGYVNYSHIIDSGSQYACKGFSLWPTLGPMQMDANFSSRVKRVSGLTVSSGQGER